METKAVEKYIRMSPRKIRYVVDMIKSKPIEDAVDILSLTPREAAAVVKKAIQSAVANATENHKMKEEDLFISRILVNEGPTLKRFRPRARGRATRIRKRTSHLSVYVSNGKEKEAEEMGQKVNPIGFRIGINKGWQSRWFAEKDYARLLREDIVIRNIIEKQLGNAGVSKIEIERTEEEVKVDVHTSKPGIVIGRRGANINDIRDLIEKKTSSIIQLNIMEIKKPELIAKLVAESIASQLVRRVSFRKAMKKAVSLSMKAGAKGIRVQCAGRLGGAEMARTEWYREGRVPLHTLRANIDFGFAEANTTFGKIGVKVWIYLGDIILDEKEMGKERKLDKEKKEEEKI